MDQNRVSVVSKSSLFNPSGANPGNSDSSELPQSTILSLCTGIEEPEVVLHSEETNVTTKLVPAVTHEHVQPLQHTHLEHRITREIHTHDVYHRVLPIIDTEILPPRHFVDDGVSRREVPAEDVWTYTATGRPGHLRSTELRKQVIVDVSTTEGNHAKIPSAKQDTVLADKKTYITEEGHPRTEYLWLHPPVFEDEDGRTKPALVPAGFSPEWTATLFKEHCRSQEGSGSSEEKKNQGNIEPLAKRRRTEDSWGP